MKILYGINTNGQGHINRSRTIMKQLIADGHEIHIVFEGPKPPKYAYSLGRSFTWINSFELVYEEHQLTFFKTLGKSMLNSLYLPKIVLSLRRRLSREKFDLVITDFAPLVSYVGMLSEVPLISIDHQHSIRSNLALTIPGYSINHLVMDWTLGITAPSAEHYISIDYVKTLRNERIWTLYPLLWKDEFDDVDIYKGDSYIIYVKRLREKYLRKVLKDFPDENFIVYGYDKEEKIENVHLKPTSRSGFLTDFASSKGVIANAGFSVTWEAILVDKPLHVIPIENQFEQQTNAYRLERQKLATASNSISEEGLSNFFSKSPSYFKTSEYVGKPVTEFTNYLYKIMEW